MEPVSNDHEFDKFVEGIKIKIKFFSGL